MNAALQCNHATLHVEIRNFALGKQQSSGNFIVCSNPNCIQVISYVPPTPKTPKVAPKINPLQATVDLQKKKIQQLQTDLTKCRNGAS